MCICTWKVLGLASTVNVAHDHYSFLVSSIWMGVCVCLYLASHHWLEMTLAHSQPTASTSQLLVGYFTPDQCFDFCMHPGCEASSYFALSRKASKALLVAAMFPVAVVTRLCPSRELERLRSSLSTWLQGEKARGRGKKNSAYAICPK